MKGYFKTILLAALLLPVVASAQAPGTAPVTVSHETQMLHGRKYYVHIVEKGQTVYSISRAYKVQSYDAVTHVDIHFLHPGDTVWLPYRGQFAEEAEAETTVPAPAPKAALKDQEDRRPKPSASTTHRQPEPQQGEPKPLAQVPPTVRKVGAEINVAVMMPLHLDQIEQVSTSKFDVEQRGKKSYRQFEFIEFYEGLLLALDHLEQNGVRVRLNVVDVGAGTTADVERTFASHHVGESDVVVALLLKDAFDRCAQLAQEAGVYVVNPMATRSDIAATNPYVVKVQPSTECLVRRVLDNMVLERPNAHLYVVHSGSKAEKAVLDEVKRQLTERKDIKYTLFNWSQNAKLATTLKATPSCNVLSLYDQGRDQNRIYVSGLLNRLSAIKVASPTLYTLNDWTRDYGDIDFAQLQMLGYHTFYTAWDMTNQVHVDFLKAFRERFATEPTSPLAQTAYDLMLYIGGGLGRAGVAFWQAPGKSLPTMTQPIHLARSQAGLENDAARLFRMEELRFVPAVEWKK